MDDIIEAEIQNEEINENPIALKEWQQNNDLNQQNIETFLEINNVDDNQHEEIKENKNDLNKIDEYAEKRSQNGTLTQIKSSLFKDVRYYTIKCADSLIDQILENNGAHKESYLTTFITHAIYDKNEEDPNSNPDFCEAKEVFDLTIVTSDWFRTCLNCENLLPIEPFLASSANRLFSEIRAININMSDDLAKEINALLSYNGAELIDTETENLDNLKSRPTHGFSVSFDSRSQKIDSNLKLVTPDWVSECINQNTLLDELLYHPKFLKNEEADIMIVAEIEKPPESETAHQDQQIWPEKPDSISPTSKNLTLFTNNSDKINYLQTHASNNTNTEQDGELECIAIMESMNPESNSSNSNIQKEQKQINDSNLSVNVSFSQNETNGHRTTSPPRQKPATPRKTPTKKKNYSLNDSMNEIFDTVINKPPEEKKKSSEYFNLNTKGLKPLQVDLIHPVQNSAKLNFDMDFETEPISASENKINNEENSNLLYGCIFYTKSNEEIYPKDCFDDWDNVVLNYGGKVLNNINLDDPVAVSQITHFICPNRFTKCYKKAMENNKKVATVYWLEDVLQEQTYRSPWLVYHFPSPFEHKMGPLKNHIISSHGFTSKEKLFIFQIIWLLGGKYSSYLSKINSFLIAKNLKGPKVDKANSWKIPIVNANWLMELYLGNTYALNTPIEERYKNISSNDNYNHFAFDTSMVQDFMKLWKNELSLGPPLAFKSNNVVGIKYSSKRSEFDEKQENSSNKMKKVGLSWQRPQSNIPCVMFTGIESTRTAQFQRDIIGLGGIVAKQPSQANVLVVDKIERTAKLLKCISTVDNIVTVKWIIDSKLSGKFLNPSDYQVKDEKFESHYSCCIKDSLERAKRRPLLNGLVFYLSPSVRPSYQDLTDMIKAAGGIVTNDIPTISMIREPFRDEFRTNLKSKYVIIGSQADLCILKPFIEKKIQLISNEEKQEKEEKIERDSYLVELVEELDDDKEIKPNFENEFIESISLSLLNDSFSLIKRYDEYAKNLVKEIFNDFGKEISDKSNNEKEIEIKIKLPFCASNYQNYFQRRHSTDIASFNIKSDLTNRTLPNIVEDRMSEIDCFWRRHSLNNSSFRLNKAFNNTMPVIIVDFEDDFDEKSSSRSSLERSRLSDSETEISNNQFKQYTKLTLKNILNKSPNSKKNKNEHFQNRNEDFLKESTLQKSEICRAIVEDIVAQSLRTVKSIIENASEFSQNLTEYSVDKGLKEFIKIYQIQKINEIYFKCDCVNTAPFYKKKERLDCKFLIYLIFCALEEINYSNSVIFECKNFELMKKLNIQ